MEDNPSKNTKNERVIVDIVSEVISSDSDSHIFKAIKLQTKKIFTICFPLLTFITFLLVSRNVNTSSSERKNN